MFLELNLFEAMDMLTNTLAVLAFLAVTIFVITVVYVKFIYKPKPEVRQFELYENFERKNVNDYIPIKWIKDDVILLEDGVTYIAIIMCKGFDFFYSHPKEQLEANMGYLDFVQSLSSRLQLRMSTKQEDLEKPIANYVKEKLRVDQQLLEVLDEAVLMESTYETVNDETKAVYAEKLTFYDQLVRNLEWESRHIEQIIDYMKEMSSTKAAPVRESCYVVDWVYQPNEFPEGTTDADIFKRAKKELRSKVEGMKYSLAACNVKAERANTTELRELVRGHMQPYGKDIFKATDFENSNYDELIVTSNSLKEARKNYDEFMKKVALYEERKKNLEVMSEEMEVGV